MSYTTIRDVNVTVGQGIFTEAALFYKGKMAKPTEHLIHDAVIRGGEFIHGLANARQPGTTFYWSSTLRLPGDSNYHVKNNPNNRLSRHSTADAGDLNCNDRGLEEELVLVIAYDIYIGGPIIQQLKSTGVNGLGTYYRTTYGTFFHLDGREGSFVHFSKPSNTILEGKAKRLYNEWMNDANVLNYLGIAPLPSPPPSPVIVDDSSDPTTVLPPPEVEEVPAPEPVKEVLEDWRESFINTVNADQEGEDPVSAQFKRRSWFAFFLGIFSIISVTVLGLRRRKLIKKVVKKSPLSA